MCLKMLKGNWLITLLFVSACGGGSSPTAPSPPAPTPTALAITPATDWLSIGAAETYSAQLTLSDGSVQQASAVWNVSPSEIAAVDGGRVVGRASGQATLNAEASGVRASKAIRIAPNYAGTWTGAARVANCLQDGDIAKVNGCRFFPADYEMPIRLVLTQQRDSVTGSVTYDTGTPMTIEPQAMSMNGQVVFKARGPQQEFQFWSDWRIDSTTPGELTGIMALEVTLPGLSGDLTVGTTLVNVRR